LAGASLGAPLALIPVLDQLLSTAPTFGASPDSVAGMLARAGVGRASHVLDLGCGNGAVAVEISRRLGCRVLGIDVHGPFVKAARGLARSAGVGRRCTFKVADVRSFTSPVLFDVAIMLNLFPCGRASGILRRLVRTAGLYVLDDACRLGRLHADVRPAPTLRECRAAITGRGDVIEREEIRKPSDVRTASQALRRRLIHPVAAIAASHPHLAAPLGEFLSDLQRSTTLLSTHLQPATWLVRRA
jgi:SAM-dependent methyltransferase